MSDDLVNVGGRPRKYSTPEEFEEKVYEYQRHCLESKEPVTWTGLALFMGFSSRQSINEYKKYDGFSDAVRKAQTFVEYHYELRLNGSQPTGAIFALKNMGWTDKVVTDMTSSDGTMTPKDSSAAVLAALARKHRDT